MKKSRILFMAAAMAAAGVAQAAGPTPPQVEYSADSVLETAEVSMKGRVRTQGQFDKDEDSIITTMLFECADNGQVRIGTWQMREPEGGYTAAPGTVADQAEMQKLLSPLSPCGK